MLNFGFIALYGFIATGLIIPYLSFFIIVYSLAKLASFYCQHRFIVGTMITSMLTMYPFLTYPTLFLSFSLYTILIFFSNMLIVYFSLKWFPAVKRGNRGYKDTF